jgi:hypothetical protein
MNKIIKISLVSIFVTSNLIAGNEDRLGSAGATQLLVNPWSRGAAMGDAGVACNTGLDGQFTNIAGLAFIEKTQIKLDYTNWLGNSGIRFISAGLGQKVGDGAFAVSIQSMSFGQLNITTVENPEGGIGTFTPRVNIINVGYAKSFSRSIYAGLNMKVLSESISNLRSTGIAFDAGIRYVTGEKEEIKFGITLKNVGPQIKSKGDGLNTQINYVSTGATASLEQRTAAYEMPSLLSMGVSYDFNFNPENKLTAAFTYTANSFQKDQMRVGLDYAITKMKKAAFNIRAGYIYEKKILSSTNRTNALGGFVAGFSADIISGKNKNALGIQYAVRLSSPFGAIHTVGLTIDLK